MNRPGGTPPGALNSRRFFPKVAEASPQAASRDHAASDCSASDDDYIGSVDSSALVEVVSSSATTTGPSASGGGLVSQDVADELYLSSVKERSSSGKKIRALEKFKTLATCKIKELEQVKQRQQQELDALKRNLSDVLKGERVAPLPREATPPEASLTAERFRKERRRYEKTTSKLESQVRALTEALKSSEAEVADLGATVEDTDGTILGLRKDLAACQRLIGTHDAAIAAEKEARWNEESKRRLMLKREKKLKEEVETLKQCHEVYEKRLGEAAARYIIIVLFGISMTWRTKVYGF